MQRFWDITTAVIIAALVVLVVMNAGKSALVLSTFANFFTKETTILTGSGYVNAH